MGGDGWVREGASGRGRQGGSPRTGASTLAPPRTYAQRRLKPGGRGRHLATLTHTVCWAGDGRSHILPPPAPRPRKRHRTAPRLRARRAWCGVVWYGVVWCGVVWCGTAAKQKSEPRVRLPHLQLVLVDRAPQCQLCSVLGSSPPGGQRPRPRARPGLAPRVPNAQPPFIGRPRQPHAAKPGLQSFRFFLSEHRLRVATNSF